MVRVSARHAHNAHDTRHTTHDTRHTTHDTRHTTHDTRHTTCEGTLLSDVFQDEEGGEGQLRGAAAVLEVLQEGRNGLRVTDAHSVLPVPGKLGQGLTNILNAHIINSTELNQWGNANKVIEGQRAYPDGVDLGGRGGSVAALGDVLHEGGNAVLQPQNIVGLLPARPRASDTRKRLTRHDTTRTTQRASV
jgi:hypothetical protein